METLEGAAGGGTGKVLWMILSLCDISAGNSEGLIMWLSPKVPHSNWELLQTEAYIMTVSLFNIITTIITIIIMCFKGFQCGFA